MLKRALLAVGLVALAACESLLAPAPPCEGYSVQQCWTYLGPAGAIVLDIEETPWGVFAGTDTQGVLRLEEDGSWTPTGLDHLAVRNLALVPGDTTRLLAGMSLRTSDNYDENDSTAHAIYATEDGGATWLPADGGLYGDRPRRRPVWELEADPYHPGRVWWMIDAVSKHRSDDAGRSWMFEGDPNLAAGRLLTLIISPTGRVWAGGDDVFSNAVLIWSDDEGETWQGKKPVPSGNVVVTLHESPEDPNTLWAGMIGVVLRSDRRAEEDSWEPVLRSRDVGDPERGKLFSDMVRLGDRRYLVTAEVLHPSSGPGDYRRNFGLYWAPPMEDDWQTIQVPTEPNAPNASGVMLLPLEDGTLLVATLDGIWQFHP